MPSEESFKIKRNCKKYIVELYTQFSQRLSENIAIMEKISLFSPDNAKISVMPDITEIVVHFKNVVGSIDDTINEWSSLHHIKWAHLSNAEEFWHEVGPKKDAEGKSNKYKLIDIRFSMFKGILRVKYSLHNGCHKFTPQMT